MPLSTKQMEYLALAWQCFDAEPKIDYEKFKDIAGLASAASAREIMRMTKKKLKEEYGALSGGLKIANGGGGGGTGGMDSPVKMKNAKMVCTPTSGTKRSRPSTPASASATKKTKARKTNAGDSDEDEHEHENDDEALTPVAKRVKTLVSSNKKKNKEAEEVKPEPVVSDDDDGFLV